MTVIYPHNLDKFKFYPWKRGEKADPNFSGLSWDHCFTILTILDLLLETLISSKLGSEFWQEGYDDLFLGTKPPKRANIISVRVHRSLASGTKDFL